MKYKVKLNYGTEFIFDNIIEAAVFFEKALEHAVEPYNYAAIEPIYPEPDETEEVNDD